MNWKRVVLYGLVYAVIGASLGIAVAVYTDGVELPPELDSERVQRRAYETYRADEVTGNSSQPTATPERVKANDD